MSLLSELYNISEATTESMSGSSLLGSPVNKVFFMDFKTVEDSKNKNISLLWNFGDPFCDAADNEYVSNSILDSVSHNYTYDGEYTVNCIATINGTVIHITKLVTITN